MTLFMLTGCALIAFGPAIALFVLFVLPSAQLVVLMVGSSFFWLLSILFTSIVWYILVPLRTYYWFIVPFAVLFQEVTRWAFYQLYTKAQKGFSARASTSIPVPQALDYFAASLAIGLGFGLTQGVVMYGSVLVDAYGPGTLFAPACSSISLFLLSAVFSLAFIIMHVLLSVLSFDAFKMTTRNAFVLKVAIIFGAHLAISLLTLLNQQGGSCIAAVVLVYAALVVLGVFTTHTSFNSPHLLKQYSVLR